MPDNWNPDNPHTRPVVFIHGLGLGLVQYVLFLTRLLATLPEHPVLVPIQPHISQDIFHSRFVSPMGRHETVQCLVGLLRSLGWVSRENDTGKPTTQKNISGVTMLSHSKFVSS
jgi:hypothetical protein